MRAAEVKLLQLCQRLQMRQPCIVNLCVKEIN